MGRSGATYWPASLLVTLRVMPVSLLVILMATLGMTDPEGSVTVPTTVASWPKAESEAPATSTARIRRERRLRCFAARGALGAPLDEKGFMCNSCREDLRTSAVAVRGTSVPRRAPSCHPMGCEVWIARLRKAHTTGNKLDQKAVGDNTHLT